MCIQVKFMTPSIVCIILTDDTLVGDSPECVCGCEAGGERVGLGHDRGGGGRSQLRPHRATEYNRVQKIVKQWSPLQHNTFC